MSSRRAMYLRAQAKAIDPVQWKYWYKLLKADFKRR